MDVRRWAGGVRLVSGLPLYRLYPRPLVVDRWGLVWTVYPQWIEMFCDRVLGRKTLRERARGAGPGIPFRPTDIPQLKPTETIPPLAALVTDTPLAAFKPLYMSASSTCSS